MSDKSNGSYVDNDRKRRVAKALMVTIKVVLLKFIRINVKKSNWSERRGKVVGRGKSKECCNRTEVKKKEIYRIKTYINDFYSKCQPLFKDFIALKAFCF